MRSWDALPDVPLAAPAPFSRTCRAHGLTSLRELGRHLCELPYGRGVDRADYAGVLRYRRGTCSSKHAFLAATAAEQPVALVLTLGLYDMTEANTPGVGDVLRRAGLASIPEAHCYVRFQDERIDVTRSGATPDEEIRFLVEEAISPEQIGAYKVAWHEQHLRRLCEERHPERHWREVWRIREACIAALEQR